MEADAKHDQRGHRCINGAPGLKVPTEVIRKQCARYMRRGKPIHLPERFNDTDFSIVAQYQAEYRGVVNYYLMAFNVHRLWRFHWIAQTSLLKTLANKFRTSVRDVQRRYAATVELPHGPQKVLEVVIDRGPKRKPLVARFGGIELRWQKFAHLDDKPSLQRS